mmetsp:Transcript_36879/g.78250  ORF Transcript_36879/g.78250 Transcript_36879/m.78250 type:complete len:237 (+) Transcript_36879:302-1012(+)|eukprot:CAMPEP_0206474738 /NCGR_PEP_ID=MMETSP0324_2-20121206/33660_1 /ASSEMBLY_ACC=CAM_ASM_000836 /TAXON_ID=2866 /ORGANISM="Crypthecodinium cohnii, Strain Seligo" /LENGTH=236 /DNA_ID=CAMNT_0053949957 /DNA_START=232 /DNA_END=942 /DNA_ORIENTATION=+
MPTHHQVARAAIQLSFLGAVLGVIDLCLDFITYIRETHFGYLDWVLLSGSVCGVLWPLIGWMAMRSAKGSKLFCCFSLGNYVGGIQEVLLQLMLCTVLYAVFRMEILTEKCDSPEELQTTCGDSTRKQMQELCTVLEVLYYNGTLSNTSKAFGNDRSWSEDLEEICIHRAQTATSIGLVACGVTFVTRCCSMVAHCRAGYLGTELAFGWGKAQTLEDDFDSMEDPESSYSSSTSMA